MAAATESSPAESSFSEEVSKLMGQGKRHLVCSEVLQAVKCFEEATQKLDGQYGSGSDECGEAYLFYGKALLELARTENGVLGNALKDVEPKSGESSDEDEEKMGAVGPKIKEMSPSTKEKIRDDVQNAMAEEEEGDSEDKDKESKDQDTNKEEKQDKDEKAKNVTEAESGAKSEDTASTEKTAEDKNNKKGEKEGDKEENKDKEEVTEDKERGKEVEDEGKEAADEGKGAKEGGKGAEEGGKEAKEGKEAEGEKEGKEETQEVEEEEGEDEAMEEEEGEDEGEGIADDQGEDDNAEGATAEGQEEEDADVPTMQLAWEFLELARIIFLRQDSKESQLNLGEVYLKLGEIQLEQEQFETAAEEFQKCLDLQVKHLEPDDRLIAETAYNMGLAFSLQPNYTKAKDFFNQALDVIKLRTTKLEARIEEWESKSKGKGKATDDNPCVVDRKELEELQNLYPEIKARVDDAQEMMNSAQSTQPESTTEEGFGSSGQGKSDVPASTIPIKQPATLIPVRRKRKPEEETGSTGAQDTDAAPVKKARQEEDPPAAPDITENGHVPNGGVTSTEQN